MNFIEIFDRFLSIAFLLCYSYQFFYILVALFRKDPKPPRRPTKRYAALICARNEEDVIVNLIQSLRARDWPRDRLDIYVMADNCADNTRIISRKAGALVYERRDSRLVGKGWALDALLKNIFRDRGERYYDGYFVFDADNVIAPDFIKKMNGVFCRGYDVVAGYRNSKNYGDNWITAGYRLWFLRESEYLNHARRLCGVSRGVSGTGFMFSRRIAAENGGWPFHLLTEDIEFTAHSILSGKKIGYCRDARFFDEQPFLFRQSVAQRLRWRKGYFQVFAKYGPRLIKGAFLRRDFSCYDMTMNLMPRAVLTLSGLAVNFRVLVHNFLLGGDMTGVALRFLLLISRMYGMMFFIGAVTTLTQWRNIHTSPSKKIFYAFTFPLFMLTWLPISLAALFCDVGWRPIAHTVKKSVSDIINAD